MNSVLTEPEKATTPAEGTGDKRRLRRFFPLALKRWQREPLLHFLLLGVALFVVYGYMNGGRWGVGSTKQIALTR
jgi:hypothetical protein